MRARRRSTALLAAAAVLVVVVGAAVVLAGRGDSSSPGGTADVTVLDGAPFPITPFDLDLPCSADYRSQLARVDLATGAVDWAVDVPYLFLPSRTPPVVGDTTVWFAVDGAVGAVDASTGSPLWLRSDDGFLTGASVFAVVGDTMLIGVREGVLAIDAATGSERWRYEASVEFPGVASSAVRGIESLAPVTDLSSVVVGDGADVVALDPLSGAERWRVALPAERVWPFAIGADLYAGGESSMSALAPDTGAVRWTWTARSGVAVAGPTFLADGVVALPTTGTQGPDLTLVPPPDAAQLVGVSSADGTVLWTAAPSIYTYDGVVQSGARLFLPAVDPGIADWIEAYDLATGTSSWRYDLSPRARSMAPVGDQLVLAAPDGLEPTSTVTALDAANGAVRWQQSRPGTATVVAAIAGSMLLAEEIGSSTGEFDVEQPGRLVSLDPATGAERWAADLRDPVAALGPIGTGGAIVATTDQTLGCE